MCKYFITYYVQFHVLLTQGAHADQQSDLRLQSNMDAIPYYLRNSLQLSN